MFFRRSVVLQQEGFHQDHLHVPAERAEEGGLHGTPGTDQLHAVPGGAALAFIRAAVPLHAGQDGAR